MMKSKLSLTSISPTVCLRQGLRGLEQLARVTVKNTGQSASASIRVELNGRTTESPLADVSGGESTHELYLEEITTPARVEFVLMSAGHVCDRKQVAWSPPRRWVVHVVQVSHHDVGYTDLPSNVLRQHDQYLDSVIDMVAATQTYPDDAQFRVVVEQTWSLDHYLRQADPSRTIEMVKLLKSGHVEVTALFGNLITELCGPEVMARATYQAFRLKRKYGVPIISAEHNDITGFTWGICSALMEAGIKLFCAGLPLYYDWDGNFPLRSFWDQLAIFKQPGPGAFWWESPQGKRLLFWCNSGWSGDCHAGLPGLADQLLQLQQKGYPYSVLRWQVSGGARDNSPYIEGYAHSIRAWNEQWVYPHLVCSTNARFYHDFIQQVPADLPVFRGELPGQDYPSGSTSTAAATAVNRGAQQALLSAERLATFSAAVTDLSYPSQEIAQAYEEVLWHHEHTWGHHFPCGPTYRASQHEKAVHAFRAAALAHDITSRALARIADHVRLDGEGIHLVVFNPSPVVRTGVVRHPMREFDNCGSTMGQVPPEEDPQGEGYLRGFLLTDRFHVNPPPNLVAGKFDLVDLLTGVPVPFQLVGLDADDVPESFAPERFALGSGGKRYGFMEGPRGLQRDCVFIADEVPACGYKTYKLVPRDDSPEFPVHLKADANSIENEFYRVTLDLSDGRVVSIYDKEAGRELLDADVPHGFGDMLIRTPDTTKPRRLRKMKLRPGKAGPVCATIERTVAAFGHPAVRQAITLYTGIKRVDFAVRILKDATPLLDVHMAFPFAASPPRFRYQGVLSALDPIKDYLPGAYSDAITVQDWVKVSDGRYSILWSSLDAPVVGLGGLWPGYVSPAHSCLVTNRIKHPPLREADLKTGVIYSLLFHNNFGTNFTPSQPGDFLFRYSIFSQASAITDSEAARLGEEVARPFQAIFTKHPRPRPLPSSCSLLEVDRPEIMLLAYKHAEDGSGYVLRLWNTANHEVSSKITLRFLQIETVSLSNLGEEDLGENLAFEGSTFAVMLPPKGLVTVRVTGQPGADLCERKEGK